jgi:hypothetical protein
MKSPETIDGGRRRGRSVLSGARMGMVRGARRVRQ